MILSKKHHNKITPSSIDNLSISDQQLFQQFGLGPNETPPFTHIHKAFEKKAQAYPGAIAIEHLGQEISYGELNRRANLLALKLKLKGVAPGHNVGLFAERSISMIIGLLATLKVGAAFVPQDARITPQNQLSHIIDAASIQVVLTTTGLDSRIPRSQAITLIDIDDFIIKNRHQKAQPTCQNDNTDRPCFILFTSGTTGQPNGVKVKHSNVCNILLTQPGNLGMKLGLKVSQILNVSFDMAMWEILGALSHGCTLIIRGKDIEAAVKKADIVIATPTILAALDAKKLTHIKTAAVAGEPCPASLANTWASFCNFYNCCGPTEVTIINTMQKYDPKKGHLTIGKPTPNNTVYILDENLKPCPIGETGEIWAGGDCVTSGYLNNAELTRERYRLDPFLGHENIMFRTRDLGRWVANGEIEHFGRTDDQVKIRGFRVELDSVSNALESFGACQQAVTLKLDSRNLVAFVRPPYLDLKQMEEQLRKVLPYYSIPSFIIPLESFPMTSRGKVDKRALTIMAVKLIDLSKTPERLPTLIGALA